MNLFDKIFRKKEKEVLIIQYPYVIKPDVKAKRVKELSEMMEKGVIILGPTAHILSVPKSVDIIVDPTVCIEEEEK